MQNKCHWPYISNLLSQRQSETEKERKLVRCEMNTKEDIKERYKKARYKKAESGTGPGTRRMGD